MSLSARWLAWTRVDQETIWVEGSKFLFFFQAELHRKAVARLLVKAGTHQFVLIQISSQTEANFQILLRKKMFSWCFCREKESTPWTTADISPACQQRKKTLSTNTWRPQDSCLQKRTNGRTELLPRLFIVGLRNRPGQCWSSWSQKKKKLIFRCSLSF